MANKINNINSKQLKKELDNKKTEKMYFFTGEEEGEKDKLITQILKLFFKGDFDSSRSTGYFHAENGEIMDAVDFALSSSMFSNRRACIIRNIDALSVKKENKLLLADLFANISDGTLLILTTVKNTPPAVISQENLKKMKVVQFWKFFDSDIYSYVTLELKKAGMTCDDKAVSLLAELTGRDIRKIDEAIDMIKFSGETGRVSADIVRNMVHDVRSVSIFEFLDFLFKNDKRALVSLKKVIDDGTHELVILNMILKKLETLEKFYSCREQNMTLDESLKNSGIYGRSRDDFITYTKFFPQKRISLIFPLAAKADSGLKSKRNSKELISNPVFSLTESILFNRYNSF